MEYVYSLNEEDWMDLDSLKDRINDKYYHGGKVEVFKGKQKALEHKDFISISRFIEDIQERAWDECGEFSEDYLDDITPDAILGLDKLLLDWFNASAAQPKFYHVVDIEKEIIVSEG